MSDKFEVVDIGTQRIAVFASFSGQGGVERMLVNLCQGMVGHGYPVDLVVVKGRSQHLQGLPKEVRVIKLAARHTLTSIFELANYLRRERPVGMLAAKDRASRVAIVARRLAGVKTRIVFRLGTTLSAALEGRGLLRKWAWYLPMRMIYPCADGIVGVSQGVVDDLRGITGLPADRFRVLPNPVITPQLSERAQASVDHPWLEQVDEPVILGVGRLTRQKDFSTLIRAFVQVNNQLPCRLIILGEGRDRAQLEELATDLGVRARVDLPGFKPNPYAYLQRADLFVLSSAWEGSPNALTEALALGKPVVSTDCPSGPRETLQGGKYGPLVEVGDVDGLAAAMLATLRAPAAPEVLKGAVRQFTMENSARGYLQLLLGRDNLVP